MVAGVDKFEIVRKLKILANSFIELTILDTLHYYLELYQLKLTTRYFTKYLNNN